MQGTALFQEERGCHAERGTEAGRGLKGPALTKAFRRLLEVHPSAVLFVEHLLLTWSYAECWGSTA